MRPTDPIFVYLAILSVIQPARIQDIEENLAGLIPPGGGVVITTQQLREAHEQARETGLVIAVRRGSYCLARKAWPLVRRGGFGREIDNRRLFLMKKQRKELT